MQNSANHVKNCTIASCRIVLGIEPMPAKISRKAWPTPADSAFIFRNAARSSGGYSLVVRMV